MKEINPDTDFIFQEIGKNIKKLREEKGLTQEELAFFIDSARNYVGCIERGEKHPSIKTLYKIAIALDTKINKILINI